MRKGLLDKIFSAIVLMIIILLFTMADYVIHGMEDTWGVPEYYFTNKIPFGFLWGIVGLLLARRSDNIWLQSTIVSVTIAMALQTRYFIEGYPLNFVVSFLLIHFLILYILSATMFIIFKKLLINRT